MSSTLLSSRPISVSDDIFIVLQGSQNDNVIERPMFMPDATSGEFLLDFCLYRYKIKPFSHHFLPLIAVICPSLTPSVDSGINRIQRWSQSKPQYIDFHASSRHIYGILSPNWSALSVIRNKHPLSPLWAHGNHFPPAPVRPWRLVASGINTPPDFISVIMQ